MLRLLRQVSARYLRSSWGRAALVVGGIATGVALIVAIELINESVLAGFNSTIRALAGPADLEVVFGIGEVGFPESTVDLVREDPDLTATVPVVRGTISLADRPSEVLQLFGVDLTAEQDLQRYSVTTSNRRDVLAGFADPYSILLTRKFAERLAVAVGDKVRLSTPRGVDDYTVRGLLDARGAATVFGGQLCVMDLPAAQLALQKEGLVDRIDLVVRDGADLKAVAARLAQRLPESLSVDTPAYRSARYETMVSSFRTMLTGLSLLCLVAGIYIIYNTTSTGAVHRGLAIANLRMLGAEAGQLFRLLMLEALLLGIAGALIGIPCGVVLARLLTGMVSDSMGIIFQLRVPLDTLTTRVSDLVVIAASGIGAALLASYFAAKRIVSMEPLQVLRADVRAASYEIRTGYLVAWWVFLVVLSAGALVTEVALKSSAWGTSGRRCGSRRRS